MMVFDLIENFRKHYPLIGDWAGTMWLGKTFTVKQDGRFYVESSGVEDGEVWVNLRTADFLLKQANMDDYYTRQDDDRYAFYTPPSHLDVFIPHNGNSNYVDRLG